MSRFNPPPALRPGETETWLEATRAFQFQSAPGTEAGGNPLFAAIATEYNVFQSAPGTEAGGNRPGTAGHLTALSFNPPPALRPGETALPEPVENSSVASRNSRSAEESVGGPTHGSGRAGGKSCAGNSFRRSRNPRGRAGA